MTWKTHPGDLLHTYYRDFTLNARVYKRVSTPSLELEKSKQVSYRRRGISKPPD